MLYIIIFVQQLILRNIQKLSFNICDTVISPENIKLLIDYFMKLVGNKVHIEFFVIGSDLSDYQQQRLFHFRETTLEYSEEYLDEISNGIAFAVHNAVIGEKEQESYLFCLVEYLFVEELVDVLDKDAIAVIQASHI